MNGTQLPFTEGYPMLIFQQLISFPNAERATDADGHRNELPSARRLPPEITVDGLLRPPIYVLFAATLYNLWAVVNSVTEDGVWT